MIAFPAGARVWIAGGVTDMRCGMNSLALKVQQGLGRVFVAAVAGVDDRATDLLAEQFGGARGRVAHHQDVRLHGVQGDRRVDQRLALLHR